MTKTERRVDATHCEYDKYLPRWQFIESVLTGFGVEDELTPPNDRNEPTRVSDYKKRAVFSDIAEQTVTRMSGMVFEKYPTHTIDEALDYIKTNVDGMGVSIYNQSQNVLETVVAKGRAGLFVEGPPQLLGADGNPRVATKADMNTGNIYATIRMFNPEEIINWGIINDGARVKLGRVVLKYQTENLYGEKEWVLLELILLEDILHVHRYELQKDKDGKDEWVLVDVAMPTRGDGEYWHEIPFVFVGSRYNSHKISPPPMYSICKLNIGHYQGDATYRDSVHYVGQVQPVVIVDDPTQFSDDRKEDEIEVGSSNAIVLKAGQGVDYKYVQPQPNMLAKESREADVETLIGMGAYFITPGSAVKTATQAGGELRAQHSVLSLAASNVSEAYCRALRWLYDYMGIEILGKREGEDGKTIDDTPVYELQRNFVNGKMSIDDALKLWTLVLEKGMSRAEAWRNMREGDLIDHEKDDEKHQEEIDNDAAAFTMPNLDGDDDDDDKSQVKSQESNKESEVA